MESQSRSSISQDLFLSLSFFIQIWVLYDKNVSLPISIEIRASEKVTI
jgi:hypothetical protein